MNRLRQWSERFAHMDPRLKFLLGLFLVAVGLFALVTPLTPGSWLGLIGLELLGIRVLTGKTARELWRSLKRK